MGQRRDFGYATSTNDLDKKKEQTRRGMNDVVYSVKIMTEKGASKL
jgi:hypothetical protein